MCSRDGKTSIYLLFLVLGIGFGMIAGGEFMRRISMGQFSFLFGSDEQVQTVTSQPNSISVANDSSPGTSVQVQNNLFDTRRNAIVTATKSVAPCVVGIVVTQIQVVKSPYYNNDFLTSFSDRS